MKILVSLKRVPDYATKVKLRPDGSGIETEGVKWIVNPFDEIAVEEAIRLQEQGKATEVIVVGIGPAELAQQLRYALAMGADRAIHVVTDIFIDSDAASQILAKVFEREKDHCQLILMGKQAIDSDASQTPQLLAARLGMAQACFASRVVLEEKTIRVTREIDGGLETVLLPLPCVVSTDLRLNEPRYASLPGIMKAKKKPLDELTLEDLALSGVQAKIHTRKVAFPAKRQAGRKVESVIELLSVLKNEAKVL